MATYYLGNTAGRFNFNFASDPETTLVLELDTKTAGSQTLTAPNELLAFYYFTTPSFKPNNADWDTGGFTVELNVTTANSNLTAFVTILRVNAAGTSILQSSAETSGQSLGSTGVKTFSVASKDWTAGNCDDILVVKIRVNSSNTHGQPAEAVVEVHTTDAEVVTSVTENAGTCKGCFVRSLRQYKPDHKTIIAEGGTTNGDGVSNNIFLDSLLAALDKTLAREKLTHKIEVEPTGTAFDNAANNTAREILYNPSSPNIRRSHTVIYDSFHKRLILFGGWNGSTPRYNDVWELSLDENFGSSPPQWRELSPTGTKPSARTTHQAIYDSDAKRMIVWGGFDGSDLGDTWELDLTTRYSEAWTQLTPSGTAPAARSQMMAAYKQSTKKMYIFGGLVGASDFRNDLFELDLTDGSEAWTTLKADDAAGNPPDRSDAVMVFDSGNNRLLIFSGNNAGGLRNDLWEWDIAGAAFTEIADGTPPGVREFATAVYDATNTRMIVAFGRNGTGSANILHDVWELNTTDGSEAWTDRSPTAGESQSGVRSGFACFDTLNKLMIIFGGTDITLEEEKHVKVVDLSASGAAPFHSMFINNWLQGRDAHGYAYNPDRRETLVFGGFARLISDTIAEGEHVNELWVYDHANNLWYHPVLNVQFGLGEREGATVIYDTNRDRYIIFGGLTGNLTSNNKFYNDVWELKASAAGALGVYTLTKLNPSGTKPSARWLHAAVYDATNDRMIVFGGDDGSNFLNDVKALSFSGGADGAWSAITPSGTAPSARRQPAYSIDTGENVMLISHGATGVSSFAGDTFELDLTSGSEAWSSVTGTGAPSSRRGMVAIYRSTDDAFYFFGGYNGTTHFDELWKLTFGATPAWSEISDTNPPAGRRSHSGTYDPTSDKMMIYGGRDDAEASFNTLNETWNYDIGGNSWVEEDPKIYIRGGDDVTGLTASTAYHWQSWVTGFSGGDADKVSAFGNLESETDFTTGAGQNFTKDLAETLIVADTILRTPGKTLPETIILGDIVAKQVSRTLSESITIVDTVLKQAGKVLSEAVALVDTLVRQGQKVFSETVTIVDTVAKQVSRTLSEVVTIVDTLTTLRTAFIDLSEVTTVVDTLTRTPGKVLSEVVTIVDTLNRQVSRTFNEVVIVVDTVLKQVSRTLSETIVIADTIITLRTAFIDLSEVVTVVDTLTRTPGKVFNEVITIVDTLLKQAGKFFTEVVTVVDTIDVKLIAIVNLDEVVTIVDTLTRTPGKVFSEAVVIADTILKQVSRTFSETIIIVDTIAKQVSRTFSEIVTVVDTVATLRTAFLALNEVVTIVDTVLKTPGKVLSEAVIIVDTLLRQTSKTLNEVVTIVDTFLKQVSRTLSETVVVADTVQTLRTAFLNLNEAVTIVDTITKIPGKVLSEVVTIVDTVAKQVSRTFSEVVTIVDTVSKQVGRTLSEVVVIADTVQTFRTAFLNLNEAVTIVDTITKIPGKVFNEVVTVVDTILKQVSRTFSEVIVIADTVLKQVSRTLSEVVTVVDTITVFKVAVVNLNEVVTIVDTVLKTPGKVFSEVITIVDTVLKQVSRTFSEVITVVDTLTTLRTAFLALNEVVAIADTVLKTPGKVFSEVVVLVDTLERQTSKTFSEVVTVVDTVLKQVSRTLTETVVIADTIATLRTAFINLDEVVILVDTITKVPGKVLSEAVVLVDTLIRQTSKTLSEAVTIVDTVAKQVSRTFSEVVTIADTVLKQGSKVFSETVIVVDTISNRAGKVLSEVVIIVDTVDAVKNLIKTIDASEVITIVDTMTRQAGKSLLEVITIADTLVKQVSRALSEVITITDTLTTLRTAFINLTTETISIVDTMARQTGKVLSETIQIVDTLNFLISRVFTETVTIADTVLKQGGKVLAESLTIVDTISRTTSKVFTEVVSVVDVVNKMLSRTFLEVVTVVDSRVLKLPAIGLSTGLNKDTGTQVGARSYLLMGRNNDTNTGQGVRSKPQEGVNKDTNTQIGTRKIN